MYGAIDATSPRKAAVRSIHDHVDTQGGYVTLNNGDFWLPACITQVRILRSCLALPADSAQRTVDIRLGA